jgi:hypothetical protein
MDDREYKVAASLADDAATMTESTSRLARDVSAASAALQVIAWCAVILTLMTVTGIIIALVDLGQIAHAFASTGTYLP